MLFSKREKLNTDKLGMTFKFLRPNTWTFLSIIFILISVYFIVKSNFLAAAVFLIISGFFDIVDGAVARITAKITKFGAYMDTVIDRYVEVIVIFGILFVGLPEFLCIENVIQNEFHICKWRIINWHVRSPVYCLNL